MDQSCVEWAWIVIVVGAGVFECIEELDHVVDFLLLGFSLLLLLLRLLCIIAVVILAVVRIIFVQRG